jgi:hypothetical protein
MSEFLRTSTPAEKTPDRISVAEKFNLRGELKKELEQLGALVTGFGNLGVPVTHTSETGEITGFTVDGDTIFGYTRLGKIIKNDIAQLARARYSSFEVPPTEFGDLVHGVRDRGWEGFVNDIQSLVLQKYSQDQEFRAYVDQLIEVSTKLQNNTQELRLSAREKIDECARWSSKQISELLHETGNTVSVPCSLADVEAKLAVAKTLPELKEATNSFVALLHVFSDLTTENTDPNVQFALRALEGAINNTVGKFPSIYNPGDGREHLTREQLEEFEADFSRAWREPTLKRVFDITDAVLHPDYRQKLVPVRA